jgi:hypothetical protein
MMVDDRDAPLYGEGGHQMSSDVAERVRAVLSSAEAAASALRHEAEQDAQMRRRAIEEEARHYLDDARRDAEAFLAERQRRISELSDSILERSEQVLARLDRAEEVRRQLVEVVDALGQTAGRLTDDAGLAGAHARRRPAVEEPPIVETEPVPDPVEPEITLEAVPLPEPEVAAIPEEEEALHSPRGDGYDDDEDLAARLVALQMAVAGANRGEVEAHLRVNFSLGDNPGRILDDVFGRGTEPDKRVSWPEAVREAGS